MSEKEMVSIREAMTRTGKGQSTLYRIIQQNNISIEKKRVGRTFKNYIDYRQLIAVLSQSPTHSLPANIPNENESGKYMRYLEEQVRELKNELRETKKEVEKWQEKYFAAVAEKEGLLRNQNQNTKSQSIAGYLISKIWQPKN